MPKNVLNILTAVSLIFWAALVNATPKQVDAEYQAMRKGLPFATVTESYREADGHYRIESITAGIGVYALFGKRRLVSEGEVTPEGLKPAHFELHQSDNESKTLISDFDWVTKTLTMNVKGTVSTDTFDKGVQDLASYAYQFMFSPSLFNKPKVNDLTVAVVTGKKLGSYHYLITERNVVLEVPGGKFKTTHLQYDSTELRDQKELWLATERYYLPVKIVMHDENGTPIEQTLTSLHVE